MSSSCHGLICIRMGPLLIGVIVCAVYVVCLAITKIEPFELSGDWTQPASTEVRACVRRTVLGYSICFAVSVSQVYYYYTRYQHDPVYLRLLVSDPLPSDTLHLAYTRSGTRRVDNRHHPPGQFNRVSRAYKRSLADLTMQALISHTGQSPTRLFLPSHRSLAQSLLVLRHNLWKSCGPRSTFTVRAFRLRNMMSCRSFTLVAPS